MKRNLLILVIILLIGFIVISCGKEETKPKCECNTNHHETACTCDGVDCVCTMPQTKTLTDVKDRYGDAVNVNINYMALPDHTPSYLSTLETTVKIIISSVTCRNNLTIDVVFNGTNSFAFSEKNTLSVGESWLSGKSVNEIGSAMMQFVDAWITMHNANDVIRMAGATVRQLVQLHHI